MRLFTTILLCAFSTTGYAQIIDDSSIDDINSGKVSFVEGRFVAYLADTVSPSVVFEQFNLLDLQLADADIHPLQITVVNTPADSTIYQLRSHPEIRFVEAIQTNLDESDFLDSLKKLDLSFEAFQNARFDFLRSQSIGSFVIEFDYSVNETKLKKIMGEFRNVAYNITQNIARTIQVYSDPSNEEEIMTRVDSLPFVKYVALIGVLED